MDYFFKEREGFMNTSKLIIPLLTLLTGAVLATGCYSRRVYVQERGPVVREVVVTEAPPAPRVEVIGVPPSPQHVWISGHWAWEGRHYSWVNGYWELRPRQYASYVPGHWERSGRNWVYVEGHWR